MRWTEKEWSFCLTCFFNHESIDEALEAFTLVSDRTESSVIDKFTREKIDIEDYTGTGLEKGHITKRSIIRELKNLYKLLGEPFNKKQFDELTVTDYQTVIGYFGSWENALDEAKLSKKFDTHFQLKKEIKYFDPEKELKENWKEDKRKLLQRAEDRKIKWLREQSHKLDVVNEMIEEAVAKAEPHLVEVHPIGKRSIQAQAKVKPRCTLWFELSDLQLGTFMTSEEMGGLNKHNWIIWQAKLEIWKKEAIATIASYKSSFTIDRVVIACLGDMVEGQDIFKGQVWKLDRNVVDQAIEGANDTAAAFTEVFLSHTDLHFDILEVFGNHGRVGRKGESPYSCSMDKIYQRMLEGQLDKIKELENYKYHRNEAWFYFLEIYGWHHLLLHGDQGMSLWSKQPTVNGLEKGLVRYNQMFQSQVHFLHCGHFHSPVNWAFNISQILINGSFIGTSPFSATQLVASTPPVQLMYLFTPRVGLYITHRIHLEDKVMKPIVPRVLE